MQNLSISENLNLSECKFNYQLHPVHDLKDSCKEFARIIFYTHDTVQDIALIVFMCTFVVTWGVCEMYDSKSKLFRGLFVFGFL